MRFSPLAGFVVIAAAAFAFAACTQNDDEPGAKALYAKINEGATYRAWQRAPGYSGRKPSFTAHADAVEIFISPEMTKAFEGPTVVKEWPVGSVIVKEGYSSGSEARTLVAAMKKEADGWHWYEYSGDGDPLYSGKPKVCVDCHDNRATYSDWVYAFELPH